MTGIDLWFNVVNTGANHYIENSPVVPHVGATVDTPYGSVVVKDLHYYIHPTNGICRVHIQATKKIKST